MIGSLHHVDSERAPFGVNWCGPDMLPDGKETIIARYQGRGDGQSVEVLCTAMPARFYTLRVLPGANSVGEPRDGYEISTGSGAARWAAETAHLIATGMVVFRR